MNRSFFFIHTKIDENVQAEKEKKPFSEDAVLQKIGIYCLVNLDGLLGKEDIFLISNHYPTKWDFARLSQAIQETLPMPNLVSKHPCELVN